MSRILIDGRFVGVGDSQTRYVLELVRGILKLDHTNSYTLLLRPAGIKDAEQFLKLEIPFANWQDDTGKKTKYKALKTKCPNLHLQILDIPHYSIGEQTSLLKYLDSEKFDLVHFTQFNHPVRYRGKYVITIQDLTLVGHLHRQNVIKRVAFRAVMKSAVKNSAKIIALSDNTMNDVIDIFGTAKEKFTTIYLGVDHKNYNMTVSSKSDQIKKFEKKYNITEEYILYTGMWKKHKNIFRMLAAFKKYLNDEFQISNDKSNPNYQIPNIQLVLVGKADKHEPEVIREVNRINKETMQQYNNKAIVLTGYIPEEELPIAYAGAFAYVVPSLSEGFGWPPLEAMACGTPVISSGESCMPEILGDAPLYFDAYNVEDIAKKIKKITTDIDLRKELIKKGLEQVKKYNWEETAEKTLKVYKEMLDVKN